MAETITLHYDAERIDYVLTESELVQLRDSGRNSFKEFLFASIGIGIPCAINAFGYVTTPPAFSWGLFWNGVFAVVCLLGALVFGVLWRQSSRSSANLLEAIKSKPKVKLQRVSSTRSAGTTTQTTGT